MKQIDHRGALDTGPLSLTGTSNALPSLALSMLLASLGTSIANIALPTLASAFFMPFAQVQAVVVAYLAALTVSVSNTLGGFYTSLQVSAYPI